MNEGMDLVDFLLVFCIIVLGAGIFAANLEQEQRQRPGGWGDGPMAPEPTEQSWRWDLESP